MSRSLAAARPQARPPRRAPFAVLAVVAGVAVLVAAFWPGRGMPERPGGPRKPADTRSAPQAAQAARAALAAGDYAAAERNARDALESLGRPDPTLLLIAGEAATKRGRWREALADYARVPDDGSDDGVRALLASGELLLHKARRLSEAEAKFRAAYRRWPEHPLPNNRLGLLLGVSGRRWESVPYLVNLIRVRDVSVQNLALLGQIDGMVGLPDEFRPADPATETDPLPLLALARGRLEANDPAAAKPLLERALALDPSLIEARVQLGRALAMEGPGPEFDRWRAALPPEAFDNPETWMLLGHHALQGGRKEQAARCFWEATRRGPEYQPANYQLGLVLKSLGRPDDAAPYLARAGLQQELAGSVNVLDKAPNRVDEMRRAAEACDALGRLWEAWGWSGMALSLDPTLTWANELAETTAAKLRPDLPQTDPAKLPALDLSGYPLPDAGPASPAASPGSSAAGGAIAFADDAARLGIDFTYVRGTDSPATGKRMHEFTGGGVAATDYDGDGRPDLYFTQGCPFPPGAAGGPTDRLFRNLGGAFADATAPAGVAEAVPGFGQGVAAGDYDGDGFADLYVANVGRNRLLRSNGDGTFADATVAAGLPDRPLVESWTTSAVMADLTGDGLPDLFDVTYLTGPDVYDLVCNDAEGRPRACDPKVFPACPDRLLVNLGDGRFEDASQTAGVTAPDGNGLGVVAADFDGSGRLSLFVANDQTANHLYANTGERGGPPRFEERALDAGLAVDRDGRTQACMGVACDDADGDGRFDLFVTNFYLESNTLYRQLPGGGFEDATREANLRDAGYLMLGFGTQFLDADLDGRPDLVVTNGHVDDYRAKNIPYRMRPQVYRNLGGRFEEVPPDRLGPFFQGEYLGRGLATLDQDGDGREDFAVSHLDAPAALLTNRSAAGHALGVRLVATGTARDATGATVTVESAAGRRVRQLTAGDGYEASNERRLSFGLACADVVETMTVNWPSGRTDVFRDLAAGADWLLVEGRPGPLRLTPHRERGADAVLQAEVPSRIFR